MFKSIKNLILVCIISTMASGCTEKNINSVLPDTTNQPPAEVETQEVKPKTIVPKAEVPQTQPTEMQADNSPKQLPLLSVSGIRIEVTLNYVTVEWDTDEPSTSQVLYKYSCTDCRQYTYYPALEECKAACLTNRDRHTSEDANNVSHHFVLIRDFKCVLSYNQYVEQLTNVDPKGEWSLSVKSKSESGREIVSGPYTFVYGKESSYKYNSPVSLVKPPVSQVPYLSRMSTGAARLIVEGDAFMGKYDYTSAIKSFDDCISLEPKNSIAWCRKGDALFKQALRDGSKFTAQKAIDCYYEALSIDDNNYKAMYGLGAALPKVDPYWETGQLMRRAKTLEERYKGQY